MAAKAKVGKRSGADTTLANGKQSNKAKISTVATASAAVSAQPSTKTESKSSRKRAADLFDAVENESIEPQSPDGSRKKAKLTQVTKSAYGVKTAAVVTKVIASKTSHKGSKSAAVSGMAADDFEGFASSADDNEEQDTAALLAGFETSSESDSDDGAVDDGQDSGIPIDKIPRPPPASSKAVKAAEKRRANAALSNLQNGAQEEGDEVTTLYIGHIPHGFYERQMHAYFSQFGTITRLRLARNKRTGAPKHYAFIEFASADVADIVQRTMNKYLLFNHILQVRKLAPEQVHKDLWKGANRRFKVVPWASIQARGMREPRDRDMWKRRVEREQGRRKKRSALLMEEYGYDYNVPALRAVDDVAERAQVAEEAEEAVAKAIESGTPVPEGIVEANTIANGGEPLAVSDAPADEVQLKKAEGNANASRAGKGKRTVSAPVAAVDADVNGKNAQQPKKIKSKSKSSKRVSV